ncbi:hypothetical protein TSOC_012035 [Tetrabaena socialis]|uniref:HAT C-terminal dimerisation domain-containing protein n=1 Tax=Tetrabaena socialis TaxID=47790 RepID=A0A2J7ZP23_9CHLO|nr:hypothetical protein TSOC_012035 [Tetrabaena socialis]|eukprot:PNH02016.1 hypothetical protein TSOC_012035 [Tetrabaena socialis]
MSAPTPDQPDNRYDSSVSVAFWTDLTRVPGVADSCSEYVRLAQLAATIVPGSVEAERAFSTMSYIKNKQRNHLKQPHLSACVRLKGQDCYSVSNFPYAAALQHWQNSAQYRHAEYEEADA